MAQNKKNKQNSALPKTVIFVFGNPILPQDSTPIKILPKLKRQFPKLQFVIIDPTEDLEPPVGNWFILDTVVGIKKPMVIRGIKGIVTQKRLSLHDYDLAIHLKLLEKLGKLEKTNVIIFAVPPVKDTNEVLSDVCHLFEENVPLKSEPRNSYKDHTP